MSQQHRVFYYWMWEAGHKGSQLLVLISLILIAFPSGPWLWSLALAAVFATYFAVVVWYGKKHGLVEKPTGE